MTWLLAYSGVFRGVDSAGRGQPIPPFSIVLADAARLNIRARSVSAPPRWWQAAWLNQAAIDAELPTFSAIEYWERIPLGSSLLDLQPGLISRIDIRPVPWLKDLELVIWYEPGSPTGNDELLADLYSGSDYYLFLP